MKILKQPGTPMHQIYGFAQSWAILEIDAVVAADGKGCPYIKIL